MCASVSRSMRHSARSASCANTRFEIFGSPCTMRSRLGGNGGNAAAASRTRSANGSMTSKCRWPRCSTSTSRKRAQMPRRVVDAEPAVAEAVVEIADGAMKLRDEAPRRARLRRRLERVAADAVDARQHAPNAIVLEPQRAVARRHEPRRQQPFAGQVLGDGRDVDVHLGRENRGSRAAARAARRAARSHTRSGSSAPTWRARATWARGRTPPARRRAGRDRDGRSCGAMIAGSRRAPASQSWTSN